MTCNAPSSTAATVRNRAGFTLVELLVVIGIIALLISILLPSLQKARQSAQTVQCASNMHNVALYTSMYQATNKGVLPPLSQYAKVATGFTSNGFQGFNLWSLIGIKPGNKILVCPALLNVYPSPTWGAAQNTTRNLYTYKYNWLLSGSETNVTVAPAVPHARADATNTYLYPNPMHVVPNASTTLLYADTAQIVAYETDDLPGSDRGMPKSAITPGLYTPVPGTGDPANHQFVRGLSPTHNVVQAMGVPFPVLSDGSRAQQGIINVCYADYSVRPANIKQGLVLNTADPSFATWVLTDAGGNGSGHSGNQVVVPGARLNPTVAP